jgi:osmotically-inducible protein OsmY
MNTTAPDQTIADAVRRALDWDPKVHANALGVREADGAIVLMGTVASNAEKLAAVKAAERVRGVRAVACEISVELPGASPVGDLDIAQMIARQLHWNTAVPNTITAEVDHGCVTLRGTVEWSYQRDAAERPIHLLRGISQVTNLIAVEPERELTVGLGDQIHEAISRMADLDAATIEVEAHGATVHLRGSVRSLAQKRIAAYVAAAAPGVREVDNALVVTPE